jgi:Ca2+-binding EF-hand superfamily protein
MLTDMFNEIDIDKEGSVEFEVFLARMNYKIQGRFSSDVVKSMFRSVALDNNVLDVEGVVTVFHKLGFKISDRELSDLCGRYSANRTYITLDEFQTMVRVHSASLPPPAIAMGIGGPFARSSDSDPRDLDDD